MDQDVSLEGPRARLAGDQAPVVIDVRDPADFAAAHVPGGDQHSRLPASPSAGRASRREAGGHLLNDAPPRQRP